MTNGGVFGWGERATLFVVRPWRMMYLGPSVRQGSAYAHHAVLVALPLEGRLRVQTGPRTVWDEHSGVVIAAQLRHRIECEGALAQIFFDPESAEGRSLSRWLGGSAISTLPAEGCAAVRARLPVDGEGPGVATGGDRLWGEVSRIIAPVEGPSPRSDPRVSRALEILRASSRTPIGLHELARDVWLSPSRLAHLFRAETGLPVRRYRLWLRLYDALLHVALGVDATQAAHEAGFSDAAHLARTSRRLIGLTPREVSRIVQAISG